MTSKFDFDAVPNMSKKVLTVRDIISPTDDGVTIMHEHIFLELRKTHLPEPTNPATDFPATELGIWESKVRLGNLHMARDWAPIADN